MARNKLYDKRFHFWAPSELDTRARTLAGRRNAAGVRTTCSDVLREALAVGLGALETGARYAHEPTTALQGFDPDDIHTAIEVVDGLVELGDALHRLDVDAIKALAHLDVDVLRSLSRLDPETLDALAGLDVQPLVELGALDIDHVVRIAEAVAQTEAAERDHRGAPPEPPGGFSLHGHPDGGGISATLRTSAGG